MQGALDVLEATATTDLTTLNGGAATTAERLVFTNGAGTAVVTMTEAQFDGFEQFDEDNGGLEQIAIAAGAIESIVVDGATGISHLDAPLLIGDDADDSYTLSLINAPVDVTVEAGDAVDVDVDGTYSRTATGLGADDTITLADGANIGFATGLNTITTATLLGDATLNDDQHAAYSGGTLTAAAGDNTVSIVDAASITADTEIESYVLDNGGTIDVTTNEDVSVAGSNEVEATIGGSTVSGTYALNDGEGDVIIATSGASIVGINSGTATTAETLELTGSITMTAAQHVFDIDAGGSADEVTFTTAYTGDADADVETYNLVGASNLAVVAGNTAVDINGSDAHTVDVGSLSVNGAYNLGTGIDEIVATSGADISGVNGGGNTTAERLNITGTVTATAGQIDTFQTITGAAAAADTLVVADDSNLTIDPSQLVDVDTLDASAIVTDARTITIGTGMDGLAVTVAADITAGDSTLNVVGDSNISVDGTLGADDNLVLSGSGDITVSGFGGDKIDNTGTGALDVTIAAAGDDVTVEANAAATSTTIDVGLMANSEIIAVVGDGDVTINNVAGSNVTIQDSSDATVNGIGSGLTSKQETTGGGGDDEFNVVAGASTGFDVDIEGGAGEDAINIDANADNVIANVTDSLITDRDVITGFRAGTDTMRFRAPDDLSFQTVASSDEATLAGSFQNAVDAAIASNAANWDALGDVLLVTVDAGDAAGTYAVINNATDTTFDAGEDVVVELQGVSGTLTTADFVG